MDSLIRCKPMPGTPDTIRHLFPGKVPASKKGRPRFGGSAQGAIGICNPGDIRDADRIGRREG